ncbi:MAG: NADH-quinone oxidoreductase subunit J [Gammaproteobacteria bacterium]|nr:NADH-quinone oxidoreductase subunit J [Gammaproteobacteria bacterium]
MEYILFIIAAAITIGSSILALTRLNASHALIYLVVTLLALAVIFFLLGAPFAAALQIVVYAGAIVVLFLFVVMMLNLGKSSVEREQRWLQPRMWYGPAVLSAILFAILCVAIYDSPSSDTTGTMVSPKEVGTELFGPYIIAVELAGFLLLAGLVGAYHLGRRYLSDRRS